MKYNYQTKTPIWIRKQQDILINKQQKNPTKK